MEKLEQKKSTAFTSFRTCTELLTLCRELEINVSEEARLGLMRAVKRKLRTQRAGGFTKNPFVFKPPQKPKRRQAASPGPAKLAQ